MPGLERSIVDGAGVRGLAGSYRSERMKYDPYRLSRTVVAPTPAKDPELASLQSRIQGSGTCNMDPFKEVREVQMSWGSHLLL